MDQTLKQYLAEKFIQDFRTGQFQNEIPKELLETIRSSPEIIDCMRGKIQSSDKEHIIEFFKSRNDSKVHLAHALARRVLNEDGVKDSIMEAFNNTDGIITRLFLMHDLLEYDDWRDDRNNIQKVIDFFEQKCSAKLIFEEFKGEENLYSFCISRIKDVFGISKTFNSPDKAFIYLLYLDKLKDKALRNKAYIELEQYINDGNDIFKELFNKIWPTLKS
jgi:hypothetical protein